MPVRSAILEIQSTSADGEASVAVAALLRGSLDGFLLLHQQVVPSERYLIEEILRRWCDEGEIDLVITIGGTFPAPGPSADEIVPEATQAVLERQMPSLPETMRAHACVDEPLSLLDRGVAGIRGRTLILNLPAGRSLAVLFLEAIVDLVPPILARLRPQPRGASPAPFEEDDHSDPPEQGADDEPPERALDPEEFAAFLRKRRQQDNEE